MSEQRSFVPILPISQAKLCKKEQEEKHWKLGSILESLTRLNKNSL